MAEEIREGLTLSPRWLPSKCFYDDRGSRLFDVITALPEYCQTRTEERLFAAIADDIAKGSYGALIIRAADDPLAGIPEQLLVLSDNRFLPNGEVEFPSPESPQGELDGEYADPKYGTYPLAAFPTANEQKP